MSAKGLNEDRVSPLGSAEVESMVFPVMWVVSD